jgi:SET domain-containing protein
MPYLIPVELRDSPLGGRGVFAATNIPKGAVIWVCHVENPLPIEGFTIEQNLIFNREELEAMNDPKLL